MTRRITLTNSETGSYRTCEVRWNFAYENQLRPIVSARALTEGAAIHEGRDAIYREVMAMQREGRPFDGDVVMGAAERAVRDYLSKRLEVATAQAQFAPEVEEIRDESEASVRKALTALRLHVEHQVRLDFTEYRVIAVEQEFEVPVPNEQGNLRSRLWLRGKVDLVLEDAMTGEIILNECKSTAGDAATGDFRLDVDSQVRAYTFAAKHIYGKAARGRVHLDVLRKQAPHFPKMNQDGTVSVAACDTTKAIYEQALAAQGLPEWLEKADLDLAGARQEAQMIEGDAKAEARAAKAIEKAEAALAKQADRWEKLRQKQRDFAETLPTRIDRWTCRHEFHVSEAMLYQWRLELHATARSMRDVLEGRRIPVRNPASCIRPGGSCAYRAICVEDTQERRDAFFEKVPHRHPELDGYDEERDDDA